MVKLFRVNITCGALKWMSGFQNGWMDIVRNVFLRRLRVKFIHTRLFTLALSFIAEQLRMFEAGGAQAGNVMFQNQAGPQNEF